jgi:hypothetical protein
MFVILRTRTAAFWVLEFSESNEGKENDFCINYQYSHNSKHGNKK